MALAPLKTILRLFILLSLGLLYSRFSSSPIIPVKPLSNKLWSSRYTGWHTRALSMPSLHDFTPTYESLIFAATFNSLLDPDGVYLTFYSSSFSNSTSPNNIIAVDYIGRVLLVPSEDGIGIMTLARKSLELSSADTGTTWSVKLLTTCPVDDLLWTTMPHDDFTWDSEKRFTWVRVSGFSTERRELETPQHGVRDLPDALWELVGLVKEVGVCHSKERDEFMMADVRKVLKKMRRLRS